MSDRGAGSQSCTGSNNVGTESKAKPGQASRRQGDTPAPSFSCCLTQFPPQRWVLSRANPAPPLLTIPESTSHPSTFQHGHPGAAVAEVEPSPGGVEPQLRLLPLGAGGTGPQGHLRVALWARRGARTHGGGAVRPIPVHTVRAGHPGPILMTGNRGHSKPAPSQGGAIWANPAADTWRQGDPDSPWGFWTGIPPTWGHPSVPAPCKELSPMKAGGGS